MNECSRRLELNHHALRASLSCFAFVGCLRLGFLLLTQASHGQGIQTTKPNPEMKQTDVDGFRLTIQLEKPAVRVGEPVTLNVSVTNLSESALYWPENDPQRDFEILLRDGRGLPAPLTDYGNRLLNSSQEFRRTMVKLDAKQEKRYFLNVSRLYNLKAAGVYTLTVKLRVSKEKSAPTFELTSNTVRLTIL